MKPWSLRAKVTLWSAAVTGFALLTFGAGAAISLHFEQAEAREAAGAEPPEDSETELLYSYLMVSPVVVIVVAAGSWWMARRALRPVAEITRAAAAITADRLDARLPEPAAADEIGLHIRVLNEMLDRLQRSFEQARRFSADASHELRTPLAILRGEIEEALRSGQFGADQERFLVGLLEQTAGLKKITDNLLLLARLDAGAATLRLTTTDLSALVTNALEDAGMIASSRRIDVSAEVAAGITVDGDSVLLGRMALNLIDNAVRYNRDGGAIRLRLREGAGEAVLTISNTGPGIPEARRGDLFRRFFRLEDDRNSGTGGSGLGLSLCREIAAAHGGTIELGPGGSDLTEFRVRLPISRTQT
jgi:two-component system heavy metal sensor histidine kinase CusS